MLLVGCDPGKSGALCALGDTGIRFERMPVNAEGVDVLALETILRDMKPDLAVVERVGSMPGNSGRSMFTFGGSVWALRATLSCLRIPVELVRPQAWQKEILKGTNHGDKKMTVAWAQRAFPGVDLVPKGGRVPFDGFADALALAEYGRRMYGGLLA
jgi:hypothetical protein